MWYTDFLCCVCVIAESHNDVMRIVGQVDVMSWLRRHNVVANLACGIPELKVVFR
jgi:hypothetical protein